MTNHIRAIFALLFLCVCIPFCASAKVFPSEGASLNYRLVGFSFPVDGNSETYKVEIAQGTILNDAHFVSTVSSGISNTGKILTEVPAFGTAYTWRIVYDAGTAKEHRSKLYHFSTGALPHIGNASARLRILKPQQKKINSYIVLNGSRTMYDMSGNPVWFLPDLEGATSSANDIKFTPQHTLSLLYNGKAYEVNYNGNVLWKAPELVPNGIAGCQPGEPMIYHHEFSRLANGHYMALAGEMHKPGAGDEAEEPTNKKKAAYRFFSRTMNTSIFEFDAGGKVVWSWNTHRYLANSDIYQFLSERTNRMPVDAHENSFYFNDAGGEIFLSLCAYNRILKIGYPSGDVLSTFGTIYQPGITKLQDTTPGFRVERVLTNDLFCGQHSCSKTSDGNIYLYNNQLCGQTLKPQALILREAGGKLEKAWQMDCTSDDFQGPIKGGGGCVKPLKNGDLLVLMNCPYSKAFIVDKNKEVQWSAICEMKDEASESWSIAPSYRASIINQDELEQIIWSSELAMTN
jgi:hypothetical protein